MRGVLDLMGNDSSKPLDSNAGKPRYVIVLEPEPDHRDPPYRLKLALKFIKRWFKFRCVRVYEEDPDNRV